MNQTLTTFLRKSTSAAMMAVLLGGLGYQALTASVAQAAETDVFVTINKFVDGAPATNENADGLSFPMSSIWSADNIGAGSGTYTLAPSSYEAMTTNMATGADYATNEVTGGDSVGANCAEGKPFALVGYTSGDTYEQAAAGEPSLTSPAFVDMSTSKFVIVWNEDCTPPVVAEDSQITIIKYLDGEQATAESADSAAFPMSATWNEPEGIGAGSGSYTLDASTDPVYEAQTIVFNAGSDYSASETLGGAVVAENCDGEQPYRLAGYSTGSTRSEAIGATQSMIAPSFNDLSGDKFVVVWNESCEDVIVGEVTGTGELSVDSIEATDTNGTADGTYGNGWVYTFSITVPTDETHLAMKFSDWTSGANTMAVANNMRISSAQADNAGATVTVTAANTYTTPTLHMVTDLDAVAPGIQVEVMVEVRIPVGTVNGSYSTNYGVQSS